jgi:ATP-binding cassette subfamily B (MDR/TAP) protein 1
MAEKQEAEGLPVVPAKGTAPDEGAPDLSKMDSQVVKVEEDNDDPFRHLPKHEAEILRRQVFVPVVKVGVKDLYRYATRNDMIIIAISFVCAIAGGAAQPLMTVRTITHPGQ